jgi:hypothetical protein
MGSVRPAGAAAPGGAEARAEGPAEKPRIRKRQDNAAVPRLILFIADFL